MPSPVVIFGAGPMPCEPYHAVMAPGARTWQITQTVVRALVCRGGAFPEIIVYGLEQQRRDDAAGRSLTFSVSAGGGAPEITYVPLQYGEFIALPDRMAQHDFAYPEAVSAVIGCASLQPCSTAAGFARVFSAPFWADIFGDPIAEIQTKAELFPSEKDANDTRYHHVWKLLMPALLQSDVISALSGRQRFCLIGQLGAAGRLNRHTSGRDFVHTIPYGLFPEDAPSAAAAPAPNPNFTVMWCGSFNTWMDTASLVRGISEAVKARPNMRFMIVGGKIAGYDERSYTEFLDGIRKADAIHAVHVMDWQPLASIRKLYASCDIGLSVDRFSYEAELGSRTRVVNFMAAGKPVVSTNLTELTGELAQAGYVLPFRVNDGADLARALIDAEAKSGGLPALGAAARDYVMDHFGGQRAGAALARWIIDPSFAPDKSNPSAPGPDNELANYWQRCLS
ncbi:MAG: glycosyltransferase [Candidatus Sumerlaeota bacterium]|nr:glycosyltransferase [Candidatus Sumerlaeota bacterium]